MITKAALTHALLVVDKDKRKTLAAEVRTIVGECQVPSWVADRARYEELMSKRSSRAGKFHGKIFGCLDRAEAAERKREFAARKEG